MEKVNKPWRSTIIPWIHKEDRRPGETLGRTMLCKVFNNMSYPSMAMLPKLMSMCTEIGTKRNLVEFNTK